jgi:carbamoyltransferase
VTLQGASLKNQARLSACAAWGPAYEEQYLIEFLKNSGCAYTRCSEKFVEVAELLAQGLIIGWFQGQGEIGPRALGQRSILADPRRQENHFKVNKLKLREMWRPLAPAILAGHEHEFFDGSDLSPFMLRAQRVKPEKAELIPAVVHVDGSARYQSIMPEHNRPFWNLVSSFYTLTGVPLVLNTSFNQQEPIVNSPADAWQTFQSAGLDALVLGDFLVRKV